MLPLLLVALAVPALNRWMVSGLPSVHKLELPWHFRSLSAEKADDRIVLIGMDDVSLDVRVRVLSPRYSLEHEEKNWLSPGRPWRTALLPPRATACLSLPAVLYWDARSFHGSLFAGSISGLTVWKMKA